MTLTGNEHDDNVSGCGSQLLVENEELNLAESSLGGGSSLPSRSDTISDGAMPKRLLQVIDLRREEASDVQQARDRNVLKRENSPGDNQSFESLPSDGNMSGELEVTNAPPASPQGSLVLRLIESVPAFGPSRFLRRGDVRENNVVEDGDFSQADVAKAASNEGNSDHNGIGDGSNVPPPVELSKLKDSNVQHTQKSGVCAHDERNGDACEGDSEFELLLKDMKDETHHATATQCSGPQVSHESETDNDLLSSSGGHAPRANAVMGRPGRSDCESDRPESHSKTSCSRTTTEEDQDCVCSRKKQAGSIVSATEKSDSTESNAETRSFATYNLKSNQETMRQVNKLSLSADQHTSFSKVATLSKKQMANYRDRFNDRNLFNGVSGPMRNQREVIRIERDVLANDWSKRNDRRQTPGIQDTLARRPISDVSDRGSRVAIIREDPTERFAVNSGNFDYLQMSSQDRRETRPEPSRRTAALRFLSGGSDRDMSSRDNADGLRAVQSMSAPRFPHSRPGGPNDWYCSETAVFTDEHTLRCGHGDRPTNIKHAASFQHLDTDKHFRIRRDSAPSESIATDLAACETTRGDAAGLHTPGTHANTPAPVPYAQSQVTGQAVMNTSDSGLVKNVSKGKANTSPAPNQTYPDHDNVVSAARNMTASGAQRAGIRLKESHELKSVEGMSWAPSASPVRPVTATSCISRENANPREENRGSSDQHDQEGVESELQAFVRNLVQDVSPPVFSPVRRPQQQQDARKSTSFLSNT